MKISDKEWRYRRLYQVVNKAGDKVRFVPNNIQELINQDTSRRKLILKARQFGVSTNEIIKQLDYVLFTRNANACILAHEQDAVKKLFRIARRSYEFIPDNIKPVLDRGGGSKYEMYFPSINSRIYCDLESRGDTINWLHVSEAAFMSDSSRLKSTIQAVPIETGKVTIETTPNGIGNFFYDLWSDQEQPYKKLFFPWFMFPDYKLKHDGSKLTDEEKQFIKKAKKYGVDISLDQIAFRRYKRSELKTTAADKTHVTFDQEYPEDDQSCFLSSGQAVMDLFKIKQMLDETNPPIEDLGWLKVYEPTKNSHEYMIGADTAEGTGGDYSVAVVINSSTKKIAAKLRGHWKPHEFASLLLSLGSRFKNLHGFPLLAVERNNHGHAVILELNEHLNYPNLYVHTDEKLGWRTDMITRPVMINQFIHGIESGFLTVLDKELLGECLTLVNINGKIQAADNKHDDCVIAAAIALQLVLKASTLGLYQDIENKILL